MKRLILLVCSILSLAACNSGQPAAGEKYQGRPETRKLEGASAGGYDGVAIRKSVDGSLNKNDDHIRELDKAQKGGAEEQK